MSLLVLLFVLQVDVDSPPEAFRRAEALYQEERYAEAAEIYEALRAQGIEDGALYYNLANAHFKAGELGRAILNYERALELLPGDEDVRANLAFASALVSDEVAPTPLPVVVRWLVELYRRLSPSFLAAILSVAFLVGGVAVSLLLLERWPGLRAPAIYVLALSVTAAVASGATLGAKLALVRGRSEAIVLSENAYVRSGPGESSPRLAEIHEGLKVRVLGEREGWLQVVLANGLTGWLRADVAERI